MPEDTSVSQEVQQGHFRVRPFYIDLQGERIS